MRQEINAVRMYALSYTRNCLFSVVTFWGRVRGGESVVVHGCGMASGVKK
jgi:hypothetical protein